MATVGQIISIARKRRKHTQTDIAKILGIPLSTYALKEKNDDLNEKEVRKILEFLKYSMEEAIEMAESEPKKQPGDVQTQLVASLERENKLLRDLINEYREEIRFNLNELKEGQRAVAAVAHAALAHAESILAYQQKKPLKEVQQLSDKAIFERAR